MASNTVNPKYVPKESNARDPTANLSAFSPMPYRSVSPSLDWQKPASTVVNTPFLDNAPNIWLDPSRKNCGGCNSRHPQTWFLKLSDMSSDDRTSATVHCFPCRVIRNTRDALRRLQRSKQTVVAFDEQSKKYAQEYLAMLRTIWSPEAFSALRDVTYTRIENECKARMAGNLPEIDDQLVPKPEIGPLSKRKTLNRMPVEEKANASGTSTITNSPEPEDMDDQSYPSPPQPPQKKARTSENTFGPTREIDHMQHQVHTHYDTSLATGGHDHSLAVSASSLLAPLTPTSDDNDAVPQLVRMSAALQEIVTRASKVQQYWIDTSECNRVILNITNVNTVMLNASKLDELVESKIKKISED